MKKWQIKNSLKSQDILSILLQNRGLITEEQQKLFLAPPDPYTLTPHDVSIDETQLETAMKRIEKAIAQKESIVVYADYDADGITAGTVLWETLYALGANVMPYIPHRFDEGYGLSTVGIDRIKEQYSVNLIITVDQGITGWEKVAYAKSLGIDVIVTDHHSKPERLPDCYLVHTTSLSGSGVSWFVAKTLLERNSKLIKKPIIREDLVAIAAIGTIADMVPLTGANRSIAKFGLQQLIKTQRVGLLALLTESGLTQKNMTTYDISHVLAPRLNAMGRLEHALDALRLLCTTNKERASELASKLGSTNRERQQITVDTTVLVKDLVHSQGTHKQQKLLLVSHEELNQGIIGLVAGKLVEEFYLPSIVVAKGELISKASARSIAGFNIVEVLRQCQDLLVDVGGHPMAAGFTVETAKLSLLQAKLEQLALAMITDDMLQRIITIDLELPLSTVNKELWQSLRAFEPFGFGNPEPTFASLGVTLWDLRRIGGDGKHLKLRVSGAGGSQLIEAVAFGMGERLEELMQAKTADIAYVVDKNEWNGKTTLQLKIKDIRLKALAQETFL